MCNDLFWIYPEIFSGKASWHCITLKNVACSMASNKTFRADGGSTFFNAHGIFLKQFAGARAQLRQSGALNLRQGFFRRGYLWRLSVANVVVTKTCNANGR